MKKQSIVIGVAPTRRNIFSKTEAKRYKDLLYEKLGSMNIEFVDLEDINEEGLLYDENDLPKVINKFNKAKVDGLFFPHCNFGTEFLVAKIGKALSKPVLLWGPRDDAPTADGRRTRDSQCGLFATSKVLRRLNVPFTYLINSTIDDRSFISGLQKFIAVCAVVKSFYKMKILQISTRPSPFWTMMVNEGELLEKFGIEIFPVALPDITSATFRVMKENGTDFRETVDRIESINCRDLDSRDNILKIAALKTVIKEYCILNQCTSVAIQCWYALEDSLGIMPCISTGLLTEEGIPVACETDIHGAISAIMLQEAAMGTSPVFFADFTIRHPENDNAELLWHCGNFPMRLVKEEVTLGAHALPPYCPGTGHFELKGGNITICRFDGDNGEYKLFIGEGKGTEGPKTRGTYLWLEVPDWEKWEYKLINGPYVHHCAGVHASVSPILYEACKYIHGLTPDPVEPDEEQIKMSWLKGL